jgi:hypothetical protein
MPPRNYRAPQAMIAALLLLTLTLLRLAAPPPTSTAQAPRLVLAFYYAWYDEQTWTPAKVPDTPLEPYISRDHAAMRRHITQAQTSGIDAFVQSWLGPNNPTDENLAALLDLAAAQGFRVTADFEVQSPLYSNQDAVVAGLKYFMDRYGNHPALLRWNGKPVLFFWRQQRYPVATWATIRQQLDPARTWLWVAEGVDIAYQQEFDGHHLYSLAWSADPAAQSRKVGGWLRDAEAKWGDKLWVATAMPGYNDTRTGRVNAFVRDRANGAYYRATWQGAQQSQADWVIITSWNEWPEGTYIEPSQAHGDFYLKLTADLASAFKTAPTPDNPPAPAPASNPIARTTPNWSIPGGHFYTETGNGQGGYAIRDDQAGRFWREFQRLGAVARLGYPISRRFERDGFTLQAFQKAILQWRPAENQAVIVNILDELSRAGLDAPLADQFQVPPPLPAGWDGPAAWPQVVSRRQALLDPFPALKRHYLATPDPLTTLGLPTSPVTDQGTHYAIRLQRAVLQQWKQDLPWASAGQITLANTGDIAKTLGWLPPAALLPEPVQ